MGVESIGLGMNEYHQVIERILEAEQFLNRYFQAPSLTQFRYVPVMNQDRTTWPVHFESKWHHGTRWEKDRSDEVPGKYAAGKTAVFHLFDPKNIFDPHFEDLETQNNYAAASSMVHNVIQHLALSVWAPETVSTRRDTLYQQLRGEDSTDSVLLTVVRSRQTQRGAAIRGLYALHVSEMLAPTDLAALAQSNLDAALRHIKVRTGEDLLDRAHDKAHDAYWGHSQTNVHHLRE